jgi:hypothetical protein
MSYFKRKKVKVKVFPYGNETYNAMAFDDKYGVSNCFGTTPEKAKEMALFRLKKCYEDENLPKDMKKFITYNKEIGKWEVFEE